VMSTWPLLCRPSMRKFISNTDPVFTVFRQFFDDWSGFK
jgi:hypothetical protein